MCDNYNNNIVDVNLDEMIVLEKQDKYSLDDLYRVFDYLCFVSPSYRKVARGFFYAWCIRVVLK